MSKIINKLLKDSILNQEGNVVKISKDKLLDLIELAEETEELKDRLQMSPYGDDKIDELEEIIRNLNFQLESKNKDIYKLGYQVNKMKIEIEELKQKILK